MPGCSNRALREYVIHETCNFDILRYPLIVGFAEEWGAAMLRDVIANQMREVERKLAEPYIPRDVRWPGGDDDLIRVVIGPRRAGKSFLALHRMGETGKFGYVNFDDERLKGLADFDALVAALNAVCGNPERLLLDEIQNVPDWELLVNRLQRQGLRLTLTGSNAHLLSSELATHLTGRHIPIILFPFSFREFVHSRKTGLSGAEMAEMFRTYAESGGYPEPLMKGLAIRDYLSTLFNSILYKDVVVRHKIRMHAAIEDVARALINGCSQRFTFPRLGKVVGGINPRTAQRYVGYLEEAFLLFAVKRFSYKYALQTSAPRKVYFVDNGLVTMNSLMFSSNRGALYENVVACDLRAREMAGLIQLYYWQGTGQEEVDFVIKEGATVTALIQVCVDPSRAGVFNREARALLKAAKGTGCSNLVILTDSQAGATDVTWYGETARIRMIPLWRWLTNRD